MIKLTKKIEYGLICLKHLSDCDQAKLISARELADLYQLPFDTTSKVLQQLNNHQVVESIKGLKGGYQLKIDLSKLSYFDYCQMIEGQQFNVSCLHQDCGIYATCNISGPIQNLERSLQLFFTQLSIKEIIGDQLKLDILELVQKNNPELEAMR